MSWIITNSINMYQIILSSSLLIIRIVIITAPSPGGVPPSPDSPVATRCFVVCGVLDLQRLRQRLTMCLREAAEQFLGTSFGLFDVVRRPSDFHSFHVVFTLFFGVSHGWKPQIWWLIIIFGNRDSGFLRKCWTPQGLMFDHDHFPIWKFRYIYNWVLNAVCSGTPAGYFWTTDIHIQKKPNLHVVGGMSGEKPPYGVYLTGFDL